MPSHSQSKPLALRCVFSATVSAKHAVCEFASHPTSPGRSVLCTRPVIRAGCGELSALLLENARFHLAHGTNSSPATHKARVHAGGLRGLQAALGSTTACPNVQILIRGAQQRFGSLSQLPFQTIIRAIAAWRP